MKTIYLGKKRLETSAVVQPEEIEIVEIRRKRTDQLDRRTSTNAFFRRGNEFLLDFDATIVAQPFEKKRRRRESRTNNDEEQDEDKHSNG